MAHVHLYGEKEPNIHYRKCSICGSMESLIEYPRENYLQEYWGEGIHSDLEAQKWNLTEFKNDQGESKVESVLKHCSGETILEIACAPGSLLKAATDRGFYCLGVEPSKEYAPAIREYSGCEVLQGFFEDLHFDQAFQNVIAMDLLEHLRDTEGFVQRCKNLLNDKGSLILMAPIFFADGQWNDAHYQPEHVFLPSQAYMQELLSEYFREVSFDRWICGHELAIGRFPK